MPYDNTQWPLEYYKCAYSEHCMEGVKYGCPECGGVFCREHVKKYDDNGKALEQPVCPHCNGRWAEKKTG